MFRFVNQSATDKAIKAIVARPVSALGQMIVDKAREYAPEDTGFLKSAIGWTYRQDTGQLQIHADAPYSLMVEVGTSKMAAQPYLRPALQAAPDLWKRVSSVQLQFQTHASNATRAMKSQIETSHQGRTGVRVRLHD